MNFSWGFQQIKLRTEGRENGDLEAEAPYSGGPINLRMSKTSILIRLLRIYFPQNWEFGSALSKLRIFFLGGGRLLKTPTPLGTSLVPYRDLVWYNSKHITLNIIKITLFGSLHCIKDYLDVMYPPKKIFFITLFLQNDRNGAKFWNLMHIKYASESKQCQK
jgi:hypothetical protein